MSWLKDYFSFTRRERIAFICLLILLGIFFWLPEFFRPAEKIKIVPADIKAAVSSMNDADSLSQPDSGDNPKTKGAGIDGTITLFRFDPNSLDEAGWLKLGLSPREVKTILNYRSKGGRFRTAEDLRKIYSLKKENADRIIPYVSIPGKEKEASDAKATPGEAGKKLQVNVNTATLEEWKTLPGVGEVLSNRIVKYRERMGGFSSIEQVARTYGLKDSTFQLIRPFLVIHEKSSKGIDLNKAYENELMECEGMNTDLAKAILIYRKNHGRFESVNDLKKIIIVSEEVFRKIAPCMRVDKEN